MTTSFLARWLPQPNNGSRREQLRACAGAICGLLLTGLHLPFPAGPGQRQPST